MKTTIAIFLLLVLITPAVFFGQQKNDSIWKVAEMPSPAGPSSGEPYLSVSGSALFMSWFEKTKDGHALKFAKWDGKGWTSANTIHSSNRFFVNWADFPSINVLSDGSLVTHWLEKKGEGSYAYHVMVASSKDGGKTWSTASSPHRDTSPTEHGFATIFDQKQGNFSIVWLDGRNLKMGHGHETSGSMALYYTNHQNGAFQKEEILDSRVCDCCQTDGAMTQQGPIVVYRDRTDKEIRDISYIRREGGKWSTPATLAQDNWNIAGCPVNGPAVVASGNRVVVAWFNGANNKPAVQLATSNDNGKTFAKPVRIDGGNPSGRVDVAFLPDGSAVVVWLENSTGKSAEIRMRQFSADGKLKAPVVVADSTNARASGFPRIAAVGKDLIVAWTHAEEPSRIRLARLTTN